MALTDREAAEGAVSMIRNLVAANRYTQANIELLISDMKQIKDALKKLYE